MDFKFRIILHACFFIFLFSLFLLYSTLIWISKVCGTGIHKIDIIIIIITCHINSYLNGIVTEMESHSVYCINSMSTKCAEVRYRKQITVTYLCLQINDIFGNIYNNNMTLFRHCQIRDCCPTDGCEQTLI